MKDSEALEIVLTLNAAFHHSKLDELGMRVYRRAIVDLDVELARKAVQRLIALCRFMPTVAEIRATSTDLQLGSVRDGGEAWKDALHAVRKVGRYGVPPFADPLVTEVLRLWGSWSGFCDSPEDDPGGRARFIELYDSLARRKRDADVSGIPLPVPQAAPLLPRPSPVRALAAPDVTRSLVKALEPPNARPVESPHRRYTADELQAALDAKQGAA